MDNDRIFHRHELVDAAFAAGIDMVSIARAEVLESQNLKEWLGRGYAGEMDYMSRNMDKRLDPRELLPGCKSVIVVFHRYYRQADPMTQKLEGVISRYAWGEDYHLVLKDKLYLLAGALFGEQARKNRDYRVFVDSAPVMEKEWARRAGIGWIGKHTNIINQQLGSWAFLGVILTSWQCDYYGKEVEDLCGDCTACIDACPTDAIVEPYVLDGSRCISYATIELKPEQEIPSEISEGMGDWLFGCDICQEVCPWNIRFGQQEDSSDFLPLELWRQSPIEIIESKDDSVLSKSPLSRPGIAGLKRNLEAGRD